MAQIDERYQYIDHLQIQIGEGLNEDKGVKETIVILEINHECYIFGQDELNNMQDTNFTQRFQDAIEEALRLESIRIN